MELVSSMRFLHYLLLQWTPVHVSTVVRIYNVFTKFQNKRIQSKLAKVFKIVSVFVQSQVIKNNRIHLHETVTPAVEYVNAVTPVMLIMLINAFQYGRKVNSSRKHFSAWKSKVKQYLCFLL